MAARRLGARMAAERDWATGWQGQGDMDLNTILEELRTNTVTDTEGDSLMVDEGRIVTDQNYADFLARVDGPGRQVPRLNVGGADRTTAQIVPTSILPVLAAGFLYLLANRIRSGNRRREEEAHPEGKARDLIRHHRR